MPSRAALLLLAALFASTTQGNAQEDPAGSLHLDPGEYRWIPVQIRETPSLVDAGFKVLTGDATVHVELMSMRDFRLFYSKQEHETMAASSTGRDGHFRRMVESPGHYAVVVLNNIGARPAAVSLEVRTDVDPAPATVATPLAPGRRLAVILISFAIFFVTVCWSGWKLTRKEQ